MANDDLLDLIGQLGDRVNGHPEQVAEVLPQLFALLDTHDEPEVIAAIIDALGVTWAEEANFRALRYADHADPAVRFAVACAIPGGVESRAAVEAVAGALIRLSRDDVDEVRDWATFGIGSQLDIDTSEVRDALFARTTDNVRDVRDEALVGLAHRRDPRVLPLVRERLANNDAGSLAFEAARYLAHPSLLDALAGWLAEFPDDEEILSAVRACDPALQDARTAQYSALLDSLERLWHTRGLPGRPVLSCDLGETDVFLTVGDSSNVWDADSLLQRAEHDAVRAAHLVVSRVEESQPSA